MKDVNKVEVVIGGEIITLMSSENEDYMQKLARYIDKKLNEIKQLNSNASINERTRTLFIAANIADDYFKTSDELHALEAVHERYVTEMGRMQEENYLLTGKLHELQDQLNQSRAELDAYIENFDSGDNNEDSDNVVSMNKRAGKIG